jgi:uncharacterized repeat protein (TIGR01451 family)
VRRVAPVGVAVLLGTLFLLLPGYERAVPARAAQTSCPGQVAIANGDFEAPVLAPNSMSLIPEGDMPGWKTTAPDKVFEHWREVRQGFNAGSGSQFVELNANYVSQLYQDLPTTPGQTLRWELKHRGRLGTDVMATKIGPPGGVLVQQGPQISDGPAVWGTYSGIYTVPAGQTTTRFAFDSISAAQNKPTHGNFLDGIAFGNAPCLLTTASVTPSAGNVGDVLTYTVNTSNQGGNPAKNVIFTDELPAGVTFVPGSIRSITGSSTTTVTEAADSDTGEYDSASRTVRVRAGAGAGTSSGGQIPVSEARAFSYQARVTSAAAASTVSNDAAVSYLDPLTNSTVTGTSNTVNTTVAPAADLAISATVTTGGTVTAGLGTTAVVTVVNKGPNTANTVRASAVVPFGIVGIGATSPQGTCSVSGYVATCDIASLAGGATATMSVTGTVIPQATPGAQATLTASATSGTYEINQADNATSVSAAVATVADLRVVQTYSPAVPVAGGTVTYTATVSNNGPSTARDIVLTDPIATGSTFVSATPSSGSCALATATRTVECSLPNTDPGATATVTIVVQLDSGGTGAVNNAVSVAASTPESNVADNNYSVQSAGTAEADVGVQLTIGATSAKPGETVPFTLTVTNNGPSTATNVSFNTVVPVGFTVNRPASAYCTTTACTFPALPASAVVKISGTVTVGANAAAGSQKASTTVISPTTDPNAANDTSVVTFTIELEADLTVTQVLSNHTDGSQPLIAGHQVKGVVTVGNDGPTRAEGVVLRQAVPAGRIIPVATQTGGTCAFQGTGTPGTITNDGGIYVCTRPSLATSASWQIEFGGVLLAASYTGATYSRTATVSATTADPDSADNSVTTTRAVERRSNLRVVKTASPTSLVQSDQLTFTIRVSNAGPSDATNVLVREEPDAGLVLLTGTTSAGSYDPGALIWTLPQVVVGAPAEQLALTATAQGSGTLTDWSRILSSDSTETDSSDNTDWATVTAAPAAPVLKLEAFTSLAPSSAVGAGAGTVISYSYRITNTGNLTMSSVSVAGTRGLAGSCGVTTLVPGGSVTCAAAGTYTVTSADITAGVPISDVVTAKAQAPINIEPIAYAQVTASVPVVVAQPSLTAVVTPVVSVPGRQHAAAAGDLIDYEYVVTNNGNVDMDSIVLTDTRTSGISCPQSTLVIGGTMTCTIPSGNRYTVTAADLDAGGSVVNATTVTGIPDATSTVLTYGPFSTSVMVAPPAPALGLAVVAAPSGGGSVAAGDSIAYTYTVSNSGNVTVGGLTVTDSKVSGIVCPATVPAGGSVSCHTTVGGGYPVTQADIDAGDPISNDAIVSGTGVAPGSAVVHAEAGTSVAVVASAPTLTLAVTTTSRAGGVVFGDRVDSRYRIRNTGNVTMAGIAVADTLGGAASCPAATLTVGATMDCDSAAYLVRQADVDAGGNLAGAARVNARAPTQTTATQRATAVISVAVAPGTARLTIAGAAIVSPPEHANGVEAGDTIGYTFTVTNPGSLTMRDVEVEDSRSGAANCPRDTLSPGDQMTCRTLADYTVTDDDVAGAASTGGEVRNQATVAARGYTFGPVELGVPVFVAAPAITVRTTATVSPAMRQDAAETGDTISYTYQVINSGNRPMAGIAVSTTRVGPVTCPRAVLAVRESMTCSTGVSRVTQGDIDAAVPITEEITVAANGPGPLSFGPFRVSVGIASSEPSLRLRMWAEISAPSADLVAAADVDLAAATADLGDAVRYRYQVTNTGNVTVRSLTVDDPRAGGVTCADTRLPVGVATTCRADRPYRVSQDDIDDSRPVAGRASARGVWAADRTVTSNGATVSVPVAAAKPKLVAGQKAEWTDTDRDGRLGVRDDVVSTVTVRNEGNITLVNIRVTGLPAAVTCPATRLAPGKDVSCRSDVYHLTQRDVDRGRHTYEVRVTGDRTAAAAEPVEVTAPSTVVVPAEGRKPGPGRPPGTVPVTGGSAAVLLAGLALIGGGVALLAVSRRWRPDGTRA